MKKAKKKTLTSYEKQLFSAFDKANTKRQDKLALSIEGTKQGWLIEIEDWYGPGHEEWVKWLSNPDNKSKTPPKGMLTVIKVMQGNRSKAFSSAILRLEEYLSLTGSL